MKMCHVGSVGTESKFVETDEKKFSQYYEKNFGVKYNKRMYYSDYYYIS